MRPITVNFFVSDEVRSQLSKAAAELRQRFPEHRYIKPNKYHVTVHPIKLLRRDEKPDFESYIQVIKPAAAAVKPFTVELAGFGNFKRVLFAKLATIPPQLQALRQALGLLPSIREGEVFEPHVTLAYFQGPKSPILRYVKNQTPTFGRQTVKTVELVEWGLPEPEPFKIIKRFRLGTK